jgi:hypothetical protein
MGPLRVVLVGEILCVGILWLARKAHSSPAWVLGVLLALHFTFWIPLLWGGIPESIYGAFAPHALMFAAPLAGFAWLLYRKGALVSVRDGIGVDNTSRWWLLGAAASSAVLLVIWLPGWAHSLSQPKDLRSVTIEMSRGPCLGRCPSYKVTIHGSGLVEYTGYDSVKVRGKQTSTVSSEQIIQLLQKLDRIRFFAIEDRAFHWCFDSSSVSVSVSFDGRTKRIVSDAGCTGARNGIQAQFVQAARDIDNTVGSDVWVKCDRGVCWN